MTAVESNRKLMNGVTPTLLSVFHVGKLGWRIEFCIVSFTCRFGTLYRGIIPPIMVEAPKRATKFAANEQYTILYRSILGEDVNKQGLSILTGVSAGITEVKST